MTWRQRWRIMVLVAMILATPIGFAGVCVWYNRPLLRTQAISVYEQSGDATAEPEVYKRLGFPGEYWLHTSIGWFVFFSDASPPMVADYTPTSKPYLHCTYDRAVGLEITHPKIERGTYLRRDPGLVIFESQGKIIEIKFTPKEEQ